MLKKAGIVVLGATAGMISLAPLASAGESHGHRDHDNHSSSNCDGGATAYQGGQANTGNQLIGVNNTNIQAPINQLGVLSSLNDDDDDRRGGRGDCDDDRRGGHDRHGHDRHGHGDRHERGDRDDNGGASAVQRGQLNTGDQLIGINNTNVQLPINQLGVLSDIDD